MFIGNITCKFASVFLKDLIFQNSSSSRFDLDEKWFCTDRMMPGAVQHECNDYQFDYIKLLMIPFLSLSKWESPANNIIADYPALFWFRLSAPYFLRKKYHVANLIQFFFRINVLAPNDSSKRTAFVSVLNLRLLAKKRCTSPKAFSFCGWSKLKIRNRNANLRDSNIGMPA